MGAPLAFIDCETTGLHPTRHAIWEVALIVDDRQVVYLPNLDPAEIADADPIALDIGRFHQRHPQGNAWRATKEGARLTDDPAAVAKDVARLTQGRHLVGAVPSFDAQRLEALMHRHGIVPGWHYHLIDVEAMAIGYLCGLGALNADYRRQMWVEKRTPPWNSAELSKACGVEPDLFDKHTALGDALWAKAVYERLTS